MRGDVFLKFFHNKSVNNIRLVVWHANIEALVESQQVACSAGVREIYRRHVRAAHGAAGLRRSGFHGEQNFLSVVTNFRVHVICIGIGPGCFDGFRAMAIGALHLDERPVGAAADGLHVDGMVQEDGARVFGVIAQGSYLRVAVFESADVGGVEGVACRDFQMGMALRATDVAGGDDVYAAAVLDVARCTGGDIRAHLIFVVHGAVVAGKASGVCGFGREFSGLLHVARGALLLEHGVGFTHAAAGVDPRIAGEAAPGDPADGEQRSEDDEEESGTFERGGALEIVQVNALRHRFGCACSGQWLLATLQTF